MPSARISVMIPTYNRSAVLKRALEAYAQQTALDAILEILVVDDGSTDETAHVVAEFARTSPVPVRHLRHENSGQSVTRNRGIREARGELILFGDDDIIPTPNLVAEHLSWHQKHPERHVGVMGYVPWSPEVRPTPLMQEIIKRGPQFSYGHMTAGKAVGALGCYFNNASLKLEFLRENGSFDESFRTWGFEDIDLGYRLVQRGMVLLYNPGAVGYHYKRVTFAELCQNPQKIAAALSVLETKEAGRAYLAAENRRKSTRKYRLQMRFVRLFVPLLFPLRPLLDSRIPLPGAIYRAFYAYDVYFTKKPHPKL